MPTQRRDNATFIPALIRSAADRHKVPHTFALAFAWVESKFDPMREGDLGWADRAGGSLYRKHVLGNRALDQNPARLDKTAWHSYGLYQLLACYHVAPFEHPRLLLDPAINADRGVATIARLLKRTNQDIRRARLGYVGAGFDGELVTAAHRDLVTLRLEEALNRFKEG